MGVGGISIGSLLIVLAIVVLLFGTKKLRNLGSDLGGAFKGFKQAVRDGEESIAELKEEKRPEQDETVRAKPSADAERHDRS